LNPRNYSLADHSGKFYSGIPLPFKYNPRTNQGLYVLRDSGKSVRHVGVGDVNARRIAHAASRDKCSLTQQVLFQNSLTKAQARGLEARLMGRLGGPQSANPATGLLNRIRSFGGFNPNRKKYRDAVTDDLWNETLRNLRSF
jgi:hypothetical protein